MAAKYKMAANLQQQVILLKLLKLDIIYFLPPSDLSLMIIVFIGQIQ